MKYWIETYGCQMNKAESSALENTLRERGWSNSLSGETADLVIINTCTVRATAETRAWGRIDHYSAIKRQRPLTLVVTGCMAEKLKTSPDVRQCGIDHIVGTFQKQSFGLLLDTLSGTCDESGDYHESPSLSLHPGGMTPSRNLVLEESPEFIFPSSHYEPGNFRAFVPIMHGCNNFCSYCIVPYVRGREISRDPASILSEINVLEESGVREITLLGQNVNSYRHQSPTGELDFPGLLRVIASQLKSRKDSGITWIRFLTSHPKDLSDDLIEVLASEPVFCSHVHLCVQSGSDAILSAMNRNYTRNDYLDLVSKMKAKIPGLSLSTDILVGFPGETNQDLEDTLNLMKTVGFVYSYMYHYNVREGTAASRLPGRISEKIKRERLGRVIALQKELTRTAMEARIGDTDTVLIEDVSKKKKSEVLGRTARDEMVVLPAPASRIGDFVRVRLVSLSGNTFRAEELSEA